MSGPVSLRWGASSDTGRVRSINQDSSLAADPVFAVADGMGGHAAGEVASQVAVEALREHVRPSREGLVEGVRLANRAVIDRADREPELRGMGTTLCAIALVTGGEDGGDGQAAHVVVANVGDSRVYLFHDDEILQVTDDHSLVEELVRQGRLSADEARNHPQKNIVTRVLGNEPDVAVDTWEIDPYQGDRFVLCSDGLSNEVDDRTIADVLRRIPHPEDAADELVRLANDHGGRDNITVVVVDVVEDGGRSLTASAAVGAQGGADRSSSVTRTAQASPLDLDNLPGGRGSGSPPRDAGRNAVDEEPAPRRVTVRSVLFVLALLLIVGAAAGSVAWFARSTYFVGLEGDEVVIFQGRPGGVLWIKPTRVEETGVTVDDIPPARVGDLEDGKAEPSLADARRYVANLEDEAASLRRRRDDTGDDTERTTTTTTTAASTTTTAST